MSVSLDIADRVARVVIDRPERLNAIDAAAEAELEAMYDEAGITPDREVISYCQGGYRAAHGYVALRLIGFPKVRNYIGSWKEWGDRTDLPIDTPQEPK